MRVPARRIEGETVVTKVDIDQSVCRLRHGDEGTVDQTCAATKGLGAGNEVVGQS
jgi:hypothetical protein